MRISDWSSDVCSSDLIGFVMQSVDRAAVVVVAHTALETRVRAGARIVHRLAQRFDRERFRRQRETRHAGGAQPPLTGGTTETGRASCRERVCQYVEISVVAVSLKNKARHDCTSVSHKNI